MFENVSNARIYGVSFYDIGGLTIRQTHERLISRLNELEEHPIIESPKKTIENWYDDEREELNIKYRYETKKYYDVMEKKNEEILTKRELIYVERRANGVINYSNRKMNIFSRGKVDANSLISLLRKIASEGIYFNTINFENSLFEKLINDSLDIFRAKIFISLNDKKYELLLKGPQVTKSNIFNDINNNHDITFQEVGLLYPSESNDSFKIHINSHGHVTIYNNYKENEEEIANTERFFNNIMYISNLINQYIVDR